MNRRRADRVREATTDNPLSCSVERQKVGEYLANRDRCCPDRDAPAHKCWPGRKPAGPMNDGACGCRSSAELELSSVVTRKTGIGAVYRGVKTCRLRAPNRRVTRKSLISST